MSVTHLVLYSYRNHHHHYSFQQIVDKVGCVNGDIRGCEKETSCKNKMYSIAKLSAACINVPDCSVALCIHTD